MRFAWVLSFFFWVSGAVAELTAEQQTAKDKGLYFYQLIRHHEAKPLLEISSDAGDAESQYYLAEIIRQDKMMMTESAIKLYSLAAKQGSVDAMIRLADLKNDLCTIAGGCPVGELSPDGWAQEVRKLAGARAQRGDSEAMRQLFSLTGKLSYLFQAAEAGNGEAQYKISGLYREGLGSFVIPGNREKEIERWLARAAASGYPHAMNSYANLMLRRNDRKSAGDWIERAARAGHIGAMSSYIAYTAHMPNNVDYPLDYVKAYGLALLFSEARSNKSSPNYGAKMLEKIAAKMNAQQISDAHHFSEKWRGEYPSLSEFRSKYGH